MNINRAKDILKEYIRIDLLRENQEPKTDFDIFCEDRRIAIETVLEELEKNE